jgi:hypothetical protein
VAAILHCTHVDYQDFVLHLTDYDLLHDTFSYSNEIQISHKIIRIAPYPTLHFIAFKLHDCIRVQTI